MATIRIPEEIWRKVHGHLFGRSGEHAAFLLAHFSYSSGNPIFLVQDAILIPDELRGKNPYTIDLDPEAFIQAINTATKREYCLIEVHNHGGANPRFSSMDREGLATFVPYVLDSLPERPYAATVWGNRTVYGEYFLSEGATGTIRSVVVAGSHLQQVVSVDNAQTLVEARFDRQLAWLTTAGQLQIGNLQIGVIGCGGVGSVVVQQLAYLGAQKFILVDDDHVDSTNLNRVVTAQPADLDTPKVILARRLIKSIQPFAQVQTFASPLQKTEALDAIKGLDVLFGCVDNDGARLILNELSLAFNIPFVDIGVGLNARGGSLNAAGGRVALVTPGGPCLLCMDEIDIDEASFFLATPMEQRQKIERGYVEGLDAANPAVISLNSLAASMAISEFLIYLCGNRAVSPLTEYDLLGSGRGVNSQQMSKMRVSKKVGCIHCALAGVGDAANIMRYSHPLST